jgi:hypothetical protein
VLITRERGYADSRAIQNCRSARPTETVQEIYAGDYFFQQQPYGDPNALVTVKTGSHRLLV